MYLQLLQYYVAKKSCQFVYSEYTIKIGQDLLRKQHTIYHGSYIFRSTRAHMGNKGIHIWRTIGAHLARAIKRFAAHLKTREN